MTTLVLGCALQTSARSLHEHAHDASKWRNVERDHIKQHHRGVPLGSRILNDVNYAQRVQEQRAQHEEQAGAHERNEQRFLYNVGAAAVLFVLLCNILLDHVPPPPPTMYTPYEPDVDSNDAATSQQKQDEKAKNAAT